MRNDQEVLKKSGFILSEGETLELGIEAELWAGSSNPIARFLGAFNRIVSAIMGIKRVGFLLVTNKRIVEVRQTKACWCFNAGKEVKNVMPSSVKEAGYTAEGACCGCFCQAYRLYYDAFTQRTSILLKGANEEEAAHCAKVLYDIVLSQQSHSI